MNVHGGSQMNADADDFSVASCLNRIIEAFNNGATILQRIKNQRAAKGAPPLPRLLEESITQAPEEIERERRRGIERFGKQFEKGDYPAIFAIQQITIQLQSSLLEKINNIDDKATDFRVLARTADLGRDNTITTLIGLRRRLLEAEGDADVSKLAVSTDKLPPAVPEREVRDILVSPVSATSSVGMTDFPRRLQPYGSFDNRVSACSTEMSPGRDSCAMSIKSDQYTLSSSTSTHAPMAIRNMSSISSMPHSNNTFNIPKPNRKNNYLGLCKCAWKLQTGDDKAFVQSKDWAQSAQSRMYFLACNRFRCEFKSEFQGSGSPNGIYNRLVIDDDRGLKYRWSFLAKSHVTQKAVTKKEYSFQCLFCIFLGQQTPVMNLTALLEHIGREHRGNAMNDAVLDRCGAVDSRICKNTEKFDINLYPFVSGDEDETYASMPSGELSVDRTEKTLAVSHKVFELYAG